VRFASFLVLVACGRGASGPVWQCGTDERVARACLIDKCFGDCQVKATAWCGTRAEGWACFAGRIDCMTYAAGCEELTPQEAIKKAPREEPLQNL
jgi:hypothetical protein